MIGQHTPRPEPGARGWRRRGIADQPGSADGMLDRGRVTAVESIGIADTHGHVPLRIGVHPGIVVGRLQHEGVIHSGKGDRLGRKPAFEERSLGRQPEQQRTHRWTT